MKRKWLALLAAATVSTAAWAQMGPGMMGGYGPAGPGMMGPGTMGGYGPGGYGMMGPGMMGGYGPGGYGMMGPGMMGGYGQGGYGMMGGYGYGALGQLNLSGEQRTRINEIERETARRQWEIMGKMHEQRFHMHEFGPGVDESTARQAYQAMADTHRSMFELSLETNKRIESVLTKEQLEQLRRGWRGG